MCQDRCLKQPLKVPNPHLRRSINCGTFLPPSSIEFFPNTSSSIRRREKLLRQKILLVKFLIWQPVSEKGKTVTRQCQYPSGEKVIRGNVGTL